MVIIFSDRIHGFCAGSGETCVVSALHQLGARVVKIIENRHWREQDAQHTLDVGVCRRKTLAAVKLWRRRQRVAAVRGAGSDGGGGQWLAGGLQTKTPVYSSPEADPSEDRSRRRSRPPPPRPRPRLRARSRERLRRRSYAPSGVRLRARSRRRRAGSSGRRGGERSRTSSAYLHSVICANSLSVHSRAAAWVAEKGPT